MDYQHALLELKFELNISQEELSKLLVVSFSSVNRWKNERLCASTKIVKVKLSKIFKDNYIEMEE